MNAGRRVLLATAGGVVCVVGVVLAAAGVPAGMLVLVAGLVVVAPTVRRRRGEELMLPEARELVVDAWRMVVPKKVAASYDVAHPAGPG